MVEPLGALSFFWIDISRPAREDVGELDGETLGMAFCEDLDWCIRAGQRGWKMLLDRRIICWHFGSLSARELTDTQKLDAENREKLKAKHPGVIK